MCSERREAKRTVIADAECAAVEDLVNIRESGRVPRLVRACSMSLPGIDLGHVPARIDVITNRCHLLLN